MCSEFQCLPRPGGLFDQDMRIVRLMEIVVSAQAEKAHRDVEIAKAEAKAKSAARR